MSLKEDERRIIVSLELEKADKTQAQMELLRKEGVWELVANRLYYALFHTVSALLVNDRREVGTHKGAMIRFSEYYVKTGIFNKADGKLYSQLQKLREDGDYNCAIDVDREDIEPMIEPALNLMHRIKDYILK